MFLSKVQINVARRGARRLLGSPQAMHAAVLAAFPPGQGGRPLWRVDSYGTDVALYVLSEVRPDFTHLVEQAGWPTTETWLTRSYEPVLNGLRTGQVYKFRLRANPTRSVRVREGARSQRVGHVTVAQQVSWLHSRASRIGADLGAAEDPTFTVVQRSVERFNREGRTVTLSTATFDGLLRVADEAALRSAIVQGIGPAKAYGCGLLTLAPASP
jgi:CRISPR-associated protein Cas6/Cse3/CasE, subtype I-E/ECOLI